MVPVEVSARIGALIVHTASAAGVPAADLQAATGFDVRTAEDPDARISLTTETALWEEAGRRTGDAAFGVHAAQRLRPGVFDILDYVFRTAPNLRAALERVARYNRILHDVAVFTLLDREDQTRLEHALAHPGVEQSRHAAEFTLAAIVIVAGQMAGQPALPRSVEFRHPKPDPSVIAEHRTLFGVEPTFGRAVNALEFDRALLVHPVPSADPELSRVVVRHAEALLAARPALSETTGNRVRRFLAAALGDGEAKATLVAAAENLHLSERSLQRRLAEEGLTFDGLLEDLRRGLALRYLSDRSLAIAEIAFLLGYSEPSAFHRALKRWTGETATAVRQRSA